MEGAWCDTVLWVISIKMIGQFVKLDGVIQGENREEGSGSPTLRVWGRRGHVTGDQKWRGSCFRKVGSAKCLSEFRKMRAESSTGIGSMKLG